MARALLRLQAARTTSRVCRGRSSGGGSEYTLLRPGAAMLTRSSGTPPQRVRWLSVCRRRRAMGRRDPSPPEVLLVIPPPRRDRASYLKSWPPSGQARLRRAKSLLRGFPAAPDRSARRRLLRPAKREQRRPGIGPGPRLQFFRPPPGAPLRQDARRGGPSRTAAVDRARQPSARRAGRAHFAKG
jgi:hypothetical protein